MKGRSPTPIAYGPDRLDRTYRAMLSPTKHLFANGTTHCDPCLRTLHDLKRQAIALAMPNPQVHAMNRTLPPNLEDSLHMPQTLNRFSEGRCDFCDAAPLQLKQEAVAQVRALNLGEAAPAVVSSTPSPVAKAASPAKSVVPSASHPAGATASPSRRTPRTSPHHRLLKFPYPAKAPAYANGCYPACSGLEGPPVSPLTFGSPKSPHTAMYSPKAQSATGSGASSAQSSPKHSLSSPVSPYHPPALSQAAGVVQQTSLSAAAFFTRAGQKMHGSAPSKKKRKHCYASELGALQLHSSFCDVIRVKPPPAPPQLLKNTGGGGGGGAGGGAGGGGEMRAPLASMGKVKVILRVSHPETGKGSDASSCISIDQRKKQVTLYDPTTLSGFTAPSQRRAGMNAPKMFAFDAVYSADDATSEICGGALSEMIQAVVTGADGCLFSFGHARLGKTFTMVGSDANPTLVGAIPCAIAWLFRLIEEQKERTGARFSVRVSAVEVHGKDEKLKDLLADLAKGTDAGGATAPGVYLREDPISGTQLENQSELRAPTADKAAFYLDVALASRSAPPMEDEARLSHLLFTLHVYQYRVEKSGAGTGVAGGRSRLHLLDIGSGRHSKDLQQQGADGGGATSSPGSGAGATGSGTGGAGGQAASLTFSALANVLLALANGQRHIPNRNSKLSQLLREAMGSLGVRCCMIAQVSSNLQHYNETLQMMQFASKMLRLRRRKTRLGSGAGSGHLNGASSDDSSSCDSFGMRRVGRLRSGHASLLRTSALTSSEPDYTSSSEQSCDTVIYLGAGMETDDEGPPPGPDGSSRRDEDDSGVSGSPHRPRALLAGQGGPMRSPRTLRRPLARPPNPLAWPRAAVKNAVETLSTQKEQWVDGPRAHRLPPSRETWIDGPDPAQDACEATGVAAIAAPAPVESRPVMVDKETQSEEPYTESGSSTTTSSQHSTLDRGSSSGPGLSDITERTEESGEQAGEMEEREASEALEAIEPPPLAQQQQQQLQPHPQHPQHPQPHPEQSPAHAAASMTSSTTSVSGAQSAPAGSSTYVKFTSVSKAVAEAAPASQQHPQAAGADPLVARVKPFVRDWVAKHSMVPSVGSAAPTASAQSSPAHSMARTAGAADDAHSMDTSGQFSIQSAPYRNPLRSSGRKGSGHKSKKPLAATAAPGTNFARVAEWVKSLSVENTSRSQTQTSPPADQEAQTIPSQAPVGPHPASLAWFGSLDRGGAGPGPGEDGSGASLKRGRSVPPTSASSDLEAEADRMWTQRVPPLHPSGEGTEAGEESEKRLTRPTSLRHPDGASNPHLNRELAPSLGVTKLSAEVIARLSSSRPPLPGPFTVAKAAVGPAPGTPTRSSSLLKASFFSRTAGTTPLPASARPSDSRDSPRKASLTTGPSGGVSTLPGTSSSQRRSTAACQTAPAPLEKHRSSSGSPEGSNSGSLLECRSRNGKQHQQAQTEPGGGLASRGGESASPKAKNGSREKGARAEKESKHKEGRSRLSFLTSPLFGKRKDKDAKKHHSHKQLGAASGVTSQPQSQQQQSQQQTQQQSQQQTQQQHGNGSHHKSHHHRSKKSHNAAEGATVPIDSAQAVHLTITSPYSTVTQPRQSMHSSSGHGSDCSSLYGLKAREGGVRCGGGHGGTSSGYESMLRDSEASSSHADSTSESSVAGVAPGSATTATSTVQQPSRKSRSSSSSSRRSRSVPPMSGETSEGTQSPASVRRVSPKDSELASDEDGRRRLQDEAEEMARQIRYEKIREILAQQEVLKEELVQAKQSLMVDQTSWTFDLHVAEQMDPDDPSFVEALQKETAILQKRVDACKSHILMLTCFNMNPNRVRTSDV